ncbi:MAG: hypothetical protein JW713_06490 [Pontiellaceae bacterium]|nr:hypothetical protein [Pontiellaceae bacterium]
MKTHTKLIQQAENLLQASRTSRRVTCSMEQQLDDLRYDAEELEGHADELELHDLFDAMHAEGGIFNLLSDIEAAMEDREPA